MKIVVSAAEVSSDIQAAAIIKPLLDRLTQEGHQVEISGIGGPNLRSIPGFKCLEPAENLRTMGIGEVIARFFELKKILNHFSEHVIETQPDLLITFDYPDFHFRLMERVGKHLAHTLKICGIPPKVWVWRSSRIEKIKQLYDGVWVVFPFEKKLYEEKQIPVIYEGNPLISALPIKSDRETAQRMLGLDTSEWGDEKIALFPGSRASELKHHLPIMMEALVEYSNRKAEPVLGVLSVPKGLGKKFNFEAHLPRTQAVKIKIIEGHSAEVLLACKKGLIKSGTSTLEAAVLGCFPVIFYKANFFTEWFFRLFVQHVWGYVGPVGLPNILLGSKVRNESFFPELLGPEATSLSLAGALMAADTQVNSGEAKEKSQFLRTILKIENSVSDQVADHVYSWIKNPPKIARIAYVHNPHELPKLLRGTVSFLWSLVNFIRRRIMTRLPRPSKDKIKKIILVGNLQAGGAGKTPLIIEIAKEAILRGKSVVIGSRGYGSKAETDGMIVQASVGTQSLVVDPALLGDEVSMMRQEVPGATFLVGSDRYRLLTALLKRDETYDLLIWDDGFQNFSLPFDSSVICVTDYAFSDVVYRDFPSEIKLAGDVVMTKGNWKPEWHGKACVKIEYENLDLPEAPVFLLLAVADPAEVERYFRSLGVHILGIVTKTDHSWFNPAEVKNLIVKARERQALLAVTHKDWVKIEPLLTEEERNFVFVLKRRIKVPEALLAKWID